MHFIIRNLPCIKLCFKKAFIKISKEYFCIYLFLKNSVFFNIVEGINYRTLLIYLTSTFLFNILTFSKIMFQFPIILENHIKVGKTNSLKEYSMVPQIYGRVSLLRLKNSLLFYF